MLHKIFSSMTNEHLQRLADGSKVSSVRKAAWNELERRTEIELKENSTKTKKVVESSEEVEVESTTEVEVESKPKPRRRKKTED